MTINIVEVGSARMACLRLHCCGAAVRCDQNASGAVPGMSLHGFQELVCKYARSKNTPGHYQLQVGGYVVTSWVMFYIV
jgi:hypothetical protein